MKDIKSLYLTAKTSGKSQDISAYSEAVQELLENDPNGYMSNLGYIIQSNIGLQTWDKFVEKYGLTIACWDYVVECFNSAAEKCRNIGKNNSAYVEAIDKLDKFKEQYMNCFMMYEYYRDTEAEEKLRKAFADDPDFADVEIEVKKGVDPKDIPADIRKRVERREAREDFINGIKSKFRPHKEYVEAYYGFNENGIQNNKLIVGMIDEFGEAAIPDIIITADNIGDKALDQTFKYLEKYYDDPIHCQWIIECANNIIHKRPDSEYIKSIYSRSITPVIESINIRNNQMIRESAIMDDDLVIPYTEAEIKAIQDLISMREFQLTCMESTEDIMAIQNEIYSLYESLDGLIDESGEISPLAESLTSAQESAVKHMIKNIEALAKKVRKTLIPVMITKIKEANKGTGVLSGLRIARPTVATTIGDKTKPFSPLSKDSKIEHELEVDDSTGEFFENLAIYVIVEFDIGVKANEDIKTKMRNLIVDSINDGLKSMLDDDIIGVFTSKIQQFRAGNKSIADEFKDSESKAKAITYTCTPGFYISWKIPLAISKDYICKGIDLSVFESTEVELISRYLESYLRENPFDIIEDVADSVAPMLPNAKTNQNMNIDEGWLMNTHNKKTGDIPGYLANNHDLDYIPGGKKTEDEKHESEPDINDYKRPSADGDDKISNDVEDPAEDDEEEVKPTRGQSAVNNYYYYTYNNSLNKNSHSFNRDSSSHHDDHSDHSMNKRIHSDGDSNVTHPVRESSSNPDPWEIDIFDRPFTEQTSFNSTPPSESLNEGLFNKVKKKSYKDAWVDDLPASLRDAIKNLQRVIADEIVASIREKGIDTETDYIDAELDNPELKYKDFLHNLLVANVDAIDYMRIHKKDDGCTGTIAMINPVGVLMKEFDQYADRVNPFIKAGFDALKHELDINYTDKTNVWSPELDLQYSKMYMIYFHILGEYALKLWDYLDNPKKHPFTEASVDNNTFLSVEPTTKSGKAEMKILREIMTDNNWTNLNISGNTVVISFENGNLGHEDPIEGKNYINLTFEIVPGKVYADDGFTIIRSYTEVPLAVYVFGILTNKTGAGTGYPLGIYHDIGVSYALREYIKEDISDDIDSNDLVQIIRKYNIKGKKVFLKKDGNIGIMLSSDTDPEHGIGLNIKFDFDDYVCNVTSGQDDHAFESVEFTEAVGDADDSKPESDHPIKDRLTDVDRKLTKTQQAAKKKVQEVQNVGRTFMKPIKRTHQWVTKLVTDWKDKDENKIKEKLADPHARKNIFNAIGWCIKTGSFAKAGLLLNPIFLFLTATKKLSTNANMNRLRNEMIGELKTEIEIIKVKIQDADRQVPPDLQAKYKLMRLQNEINKKLVRVGGSNTRNWRRML